MPWNTTGRERRQDVRTGYTLVKLVNNALAKENIRTVKTMRLPEICPLCHAYDVTLHFPFGLGFRGTEYWRFVVGFIRTCDRCGTVWTPKYPKWVAWIALVTGGSLLPLWGGFLVFMLIVHFTIPNRFDIEWIQWFALFFISLFFLILSVQAIVYAVRVLRGEVTGVNILRVGEKRGSGERKDRLKRS